MADPEPEVQGQVKPLPDLLAEALERPDCSVHTVPTPCYRGHASCSADAAARFLKANPQAVIDFLISEGVVERRVAFEGGDMSVLYAVIRVDVVA